MDTPGDAQRVFRGFVLVLVVDEEQADEPLAALARVCRSYKLDRYREISGEVDAAAQQARNQLALLELIGSRGGGG